MTDERTNGGALGALLEGVSRVLGGLQAVDDTLRRLEATLEATRASVDRLRDAGASATTVPTTPQTPEAPPGMMIHRWTCPECTRVQQYTLDESTDVTAFDAGITCAGCGWSPAVAASLATVDIAAPVLSVSDIYGVGPAVGSGRDGQKA